MITRWIEYSKQALFAAFLLNTSLSILILQVKYVYTCRVECLCGRCNEMYIMSLLTYDVKHIH